MSNIIFSFLIGSMSNVFYLSLAEATPKTTPTSSLIGWEDNHALLRAKFEEIHSIHQTESRHRGKVHDYFGTPRIPATAHRKFILTSYHFLKKIISILAPLSWQDAR